MHSYHNSLNESVNLQKYQNQALAQDVRLLSYFKDVYDTTGQYVRLTPTNALMLVFSKKIPITSVRRALSNLTRDRKLRKDGTTKGPYGRPEHYWRLVEQQRRL